ncbi:MAG: HAMP domain-containing histidine kinase [Clostridia bacterium]|nr:HAMP domain-containing histidine kinase [Clostridia bacterium]
MKQEKKPSGIFAAVLIAALLLAVSMAILNDGFRCMQVMHEVNRDMLYRVTDKLHIVTIAVYFTAIVYTVSLYLSKPSEKYLLSFCGYAMIMLMWALIIKLDRSMGIVFWTECVLYIFVGVFSMKLCQGLTQVRLSRAVAWVGGPLFYPVSIIWVAVFAAATKWRLKPLLALAHLTPYVICLYILSCAVAQKRQGAAVLLAAMTLVTGLRPSIMPDTFSIIFGQESVVMRILRENMRIYELIFVLAAMLYVNREFAWQFAEKERLAAHLDELVQERTKKLTDVQQQRQSMMMNIFHDVRTPLAVMRGALDTMQANPASAERMLPLISSRLDFVTELTGDLFLAAKLEDGQVMITCSRVDLSDTVREQGLQAQQLAGKAGIDMDVCIVDGLVVWGERMRLAQIAQNLLTNAIHYTPAGGSVKLALQREGSEAVLTVADSGKGISQEDQAHIFDRYFHTTAENKHESSGLGLTIARDLTALHRGTLSVSSELGRGTALIARFALLEEEEKEHD